MQEQLIKKLSDRSAHIAAAGFGLVDCCNGQAK